MKLNFLSFHLAYSQMYFLHYYPPDISWLKMEESIYYYSVESNFHLKFDV